MDSHSGHHAYLCNGSLHNGVGGSWIGHFLPGLFLFGWGLHWFISICHSYLAPRLSSKAARLKDGFYGLGESESATHRAIIEPRGWQLEACLKVILPAIAICLEFGLSGTRSLRCPAGTSKAGELDVQHMNSWSHATNYPPIILSGLVDLLHARQPLPRGIPHAFLSLAFGINAFLMLMHSKVEALDALVHKLLGYCMSGVLVTTAAAGVWPQNFAVGAAKSLALMMQGLWFFAVTHIEFSGDVMWAASHQGDMTRVMFTPVLFSWILIGLLSFMLLVFMAMQSIYSPTTTSSRPRHSKSTKSSKSSSLPDQSRGALQYLQLPTVASQGLQSPGSTPGTNSHLSLASSDEWIGVDARVHMQL